VFFENCKNYFYFYNSTFSQESLSDPAARASFSCHNVAYNLLNTLNFPL
jgi:hypothetical protein